MTDPKLIDQIVREVLRRLAQHGGGRPSTAPDRSTPDRSTPDRSTPDVSASVVVRAEAIPAPRHNAPSVLSLSQRVITAELIQARLRNVDTVRLRPDAVITPLVKDLLRENKIAILRDEAHLSCGQLDHTRPPVGLWLESGNAQPFVAQPDLRAEVVSHWRDALNRIGRSLGRLVVVTTEWPKTVYCIHRQTDLQAVSVESVHAAEQALQQMDVNVLVIPSTTSSATQQAIVRMAADAAPSPACP